MDFNFGSTHDLKESREFGEEKFDYEDVPDLITDIKQEILEEEAPRCTKIQKSPNNFQTKHNGFLSEQEGIMIKTEVEEEFNNCKNLCEDFESSKIKDEELDIKEGDLEQNKTSTSSKPSSYTEQQLIEQTWKENLKNRVAGDTTTTKNRIYQCSRCDFQTKYDSSLRNHLVQHKRPEEIEKFKCDLCDFQTIHKRNLGAHKKLHKYFHKNPPDEVICDNEMNLKKRNGRLEIYKCDQCDYHTSRKYVLQNHLRIHKNSDEADIFKCDQCDFQTVWKNSLKLHCLQHKNPEEVETFKCDKCNYKTIRRNLIIRHLSRHKDPSEADIFICDQCSIQKSHKKEFKQPSIEDQQPQHEDLFSEQQGTLVKTEDKGELNNYMDIKEKLDIKAEEMEQNEISPPSNCYDTGHQSDYAAQQSIEQTGKGNKRNRALDHTKSSKVRIFECNECGTKVSKLLIFKCKECDFQTKYNHNLKYHLIRHRKPEEVKMFKCDHCDYQTVHQRSLITHKLKHKNLNDAKLFKCNECHFQTNYKNNLKNHFFQHQKKLVER